MIASRQQVKAQEHVHGARDLLKLMGGYVCSSGREVAPVKHVVTPILSKAVIADSGVEHIL